MTSSGTWQTGVSAGAVQAAPSGFAGTAWFQVTKITVDPDRYAGDFVIAPIQLRSHRSPRATNAARLTGPPQCLLNDVS